MMLVRTDYDHYINNANTSAPGHLPAWARAASRGRPGPPRHRTPWPRRGTGRRAGGPGGNFCNNNIAWANKERFWEQSRNILQQHHKTTIFCNNNIVWGQRPLKSHHSQHTHSCQRASNPKGPITKCLGDEAGTFCNNIITMFCNNNVWGQRPLKSHHSHHTHSCQRASDVKEAHNQWFWEQSKTIL